MIRENSEFDSIERISPLKSIQCSTSREVIARLALKLFRGEPAITQFDWNFSPTHSSSPIFATIVGSDLP